MAGKYKREYLIGGMTLIGFLIALQMAGLNIVDLTGDITCAGTSDDPCISYFDIVNPTARSIYIYNKEAIELNFSPSIERYELYVKYYGKWHYTNFTMETRLKNVPKDRKYVFVFPRYAKKSFKLVGYKKYPMNTVKWGIGTSGAELDPLWKGVGEMKDAIVKVNDKKPHSIKGIVKEIKFSNLKKEFNIKEEAEKKGLKASDYLNVKKTNHYGDVDIRLMHYKNVTINQSYDCNCHNETNVSINGTETTNWICNTCYKDVTTEQFLEIDPETFVLKNNEPIYEVFGNAIQFEELPDGGWGYAVWTDITVMGVEVENATWANATFLKRREIQVSNHSENIEVYDYSLKFVVPYDSDMLLSQADLRFTNSTGSSLSYWIEEINSGVNATVWVKDPNLLVNSTNTTYYVYYDNASVVSSESNIKNPFLIGDDFSTDLALWSTAGTPTVSGGEVTLDATGEKIYTSSQYGVGYDIALKTRVKFTATDKKNGYGFTSIINDDIVVGNNMAGQQMHSTATQYTNTKLDTVGEQQAQGGYDTSYHVREIIVSSNVKFYMDDNLFSTHSTQVPRNRNMYILFSVRDTGNTVIDWVYVRKYLATEPLYSFGAEEVAASNPTFLLNEQNSTYAREDTEHKIYISSSGTLDCAIFSFDNGTGSFTNDTVDCSITGSDDWLNTTKRVNNTIGSTIRWIVYANSTENNWGTSAIYSYTAIGHLHGTVTDANTLLGISEATIWIIKSSDNTTHATTSTDSNGNWNYDMTTPMIVHVMTSKNSSYEGDIKNDIEVI